jgi:flagellar biosynthetic protein FliP
MPLKWLIALLLFALPEAGWAQSINIDLGAGAEGGNTATGRIIQMIMLVTILSIAPSILIMTTSFIRIVIVFSFLRNALGLQQTPPSQVITALALFLTGFIMQPVFEEAYTEGFLPLIQEEVTEEEAMRRAAQPFHAFMLAHVREKDLELFISMLPDGVEVATPEETPYQALIPAFMISELRRAFEIGFLIFVPFLIVDMLVASILMSMGMMMLPPIIISLPFKLIFFVLIDGWHMLAGSLVQSFVTGGG